MKDYLIRASFHQSILKSEHESTDTFVVDELGLKNGSFRADIAVLNGKLVGYEIKTNSDNLLRLPGQVEAYNEVFDNIYIITGNKHFQNVLDFVPNWWGVYLIQEQSDNQYYFKCFRKAKKNPARDGLGLAQLLWKDEVKDILTTSLNYTVSSKATKCDLYDLLTEECSTQKLSNYVLKYLKARSSWRTSPQLL